MSLRQMRAQMKSGGTLKRSPASNSNTLSMQTNEFLLKLVRNINEFSIYLKFELGSFRSSIERGRE